MFAGKASGRNCRARLKEPGVDDFTKLIIFQVVAGNELGRGGKGVGIDGANPASP